MASESADFDVIVIGGGVVGVACLAALAPRHRALLVEQEGGLGSGTTSRNSGVVHAGLYYPKGSLKAQLCVRGRALLYERCERDGVSYRKLGKLVVATAEADTDALAMLHARAIDNGVTNLRLIDRAELLRLEPRVRAVAAMHSAETGIVDAHGLLDSFRREALAHGAQVLTHSQVVALSAAPPLARVRVRDAAGEDIEVTAQVVVNAAGLQADAVAALAGLDVDALGYRIHFCKGDYFVLGSRLRDCVSRLIYPLPVHAGLGIHLTFDLGGQLHAGPDTTYVDALDFDVDPGKGAQFAAAVRSYLPELRDADLMPGYAGIRPKLQGPDDPVRDFVIERRQEGPAPLLVNLVGIESPGLTASPAIAERVSVLVDELLA